jgi:membrane-associated phospholipid phosphatase
MIYVFPGDFWLTQALQGIGDWLAPVMKFFTWLGYPQAYMIIIATIYWSLDRKLGLRLAVFLTVTASLNSLLKQVFHAPRPYWMYPEVKGILASNGFGMPSGHAQASTVWLYAASCLKRKGFWALAIGIAFMVGVSRVYLGVHFPSQVLLGWMIGILLLVLFSVYEARVLTWFLSRRFSTQLWWISGCSVLLLLPGVAWVHFFKDWEMPLEWILNSADDLAGTDESILTSLNLSALAGNAGGFLGVSLGALLCHRRGGFDPGGKAWKRMLRTLLGIAVLAGIYGIFAGFSPGQAQELLYSVWQFSGFFLISFSAIYLLPLAFKKLRLISYSGSK